MARAAIALGSNVGDKRGNVARAIELLERDGARVVRRSADFRTEPWGPVEQDWFVNACVIVETELSPEELLSLCRRIEAELGRKRDMRWGPRTIDVDILTYDNLTIDTPELVVPHPRMFERAFVLVPLLDADPEAVVGGQRIADLVRAVGREGLVRLD